MHNCENTKLRATQSLASSIYLVNLTFYWLFSSSLTFIIQLLLNVTDSKKGTAKQKEGKKDDRIFSDDVKQYLFAA